jgi:hypothetical protein
MMRENNFFSYFSEMKNPRIERTKRHLFDDIVFMAIASVLSGGDSWNDMEESLGRADRSES